MTAKILFVTCIVLACGRLCAQTNLWQPSPGHKQVPIWPGAVPDAQPVAGPEFTSTSSEPVGGRRWTAVERVSQPTMTVYSPTETNKGVAVVVFPGGGYNELAIDLEGTEVCDWLTSRGITAVLLKYRVPTRSSGAIAVPSVMTMSPQNGNRAAEGPPRRKGSDLDRKAAKVALGLAAYAERSGGFHRQG